jgi:hypothetical protein
MTGHRREAADGRAGANPITATARSKMFSGIHHVSQQS